MKKSELTAYIKEEIKSTLTTEGVWSRGNDVEIQQFITAVDQLKREFYDVVGSDDVFNGLDQAISAAQELATMNEDKQTQQDIKDTEELTKAVADLAKAKEEAGLTEIGGSSRERLTDLVKNIGREEFAMNVLEIADENVLDMLADELAKLYDMSDVLKEDEKEPTADDLKKTKGLAKAAEELAILTKEMKALARDYKKAEGKEKEKIVADLKKKTKLKKELEAIVDK